MTWITDENGTRWVEPPVKRERKPARALKFAAVKVGDQLVRKPPADAYRGLAAYYQVTDLWFDPVAGQTDPIKGQMVGFVQIGEDGGPRGSKRSTPIRGLASQEFDFSDIDYIALCKARIEAHTSGQVVGIGHGKVIRARPKMSGL